MREAIPLWTRKSARPAQTLYFDQCGKSPKWAFINHARTIWLRQRGKHMLISDAKKFIGQWADVCYTDRTGAEVNETVEIFDVNFIALYGPCIITDMGDIRLDRIVGVTPVEVRKVA
jgi:hypothetical protein